ncbi:helix-turn-helix transcriptional regulator [Vibrio parahaemolyticus]|uniref:Helix-turn-helix transcriptional regulator n=4 Tax=Vibrio parahaemolyticus TaxID=670 RepID=A0AAW8PXW6_VIBPH|nr:MULTISPECIES: helix-turn-helix transcriptional regulator [Vibrio]ELK8590344.1 helix-turn-helix transcriptional regulator [Vibrio vulnificus]EGQ8311868.1 hypothetical protein [Vibrio parahaemolyticus]EGQ8849388.1 hypothetical protein [Vibrio parahaemolyticus]EGQ8855158.1 hypothetical protein [Vibrio parahaemolyticus]EGQ8872825.1 hypothetical protein [Vibrio parahaemolyticus]
MEKSKNSKKKPFKWTREIVRLALNDGWTQQEIAEKCRTQQSVVSAWKKGTKQGTEQQLLPLLNIYGNKIRRNSFKVYWSLDTETMEKTFFRVEGKVILSQAFYDPRRDQRGKLVKKIPELKLVIHYQGAEQFRVVSQGRLKFRHSSEELEHSVEDAVWTSQVLAPFTSKQLIEFVDNYASERLSKYPSDANTLPFLIRQSLLNHGFSVEDIVEFPAVW